MTGQAYDVRNLQAHDENTELLAQAISRIASDSTLKPTLAELSRMTGLHRNTIRQREWPATRLEAIKENRRLEVLKNRVRAEKKQDPKTILMNRLDKSRLEVLYWFDKFQESESSCATFEKRLSNVLASRDYYMAEREKYKDQVKELESEITKLRDALSMVNDSLEGVVK